MRHRSPSNQDQSSIMLLLERNLRHNAVVLKVTLTSILLLKFSSIMYRFTVASTCICMHNQ